MKPEFQFREEQLLETCSFKWPDYEVVQSMPQMLIFWCFHMLVESESLLTVICWLEWMPWIPLFWIFAMLVVQSSWVAICFPPHICHSNYRSFNLWLYSIRGTCWIRRLVVYCIFIESILTWWSTSNIVYGFIISWVAHWWHFRWTDWIQLVLAQVDSSLQVVKSHLEIAPYTSKSGDIVDCAHLACSA